MAGGRGEEERCELIVSCAAAEEEVVERVRWPDLVPLTISMPLMVSCAAAEEEVVERGAVAGSGAIDNIDAIDAVRHDRNVVYGRCI